jgi:glycolate oxidase iron-sulfur subunit
LARALASDELPDGKSAQTHLDQCLACGSCERACPSQVQYTALLHEVRRMHPVTSRWARRLRPWLARPRRLRAVANLARLLRAQRWLPSLLGSLWPDSSLTRAAGEMPALPTFIALPELVRAARSPARGRVGILLGCVASAFDRDTHAATAKLLAALGFDVVMPPQGCCGALALHAGDEAAARTMAKATRAAFARAHVDAVLVSASGCHGTVRDLTLHGSDIAVHDALAFIAADQACRSLRFRALSRRAALHVPCTQAGIPGSAAAAHALLARISQLEVVTLPDQPRCCGAAGSYFLDHPQIAQPLRAERLEQLYAAKPDLLLTSNIGCRLYLGNGLRQRGSVVPVMHPLALLAQQLECP